MSIFKRGIVLLLSLFTITVSAQNFLRDEQSVLNFENGVGFQTPNKDFGLNLRFRMQNRIGITTLSDTNLQVKQIDAYVRRLRLRLDGYVIDEKLTYTVQLSFTRNDIDFTNVSYPQIIRDAMIYYRFNKRFYMGFGQGKLPGNRQRVNSSGNQQFVDRSDVNSLFTLDRDFGLFAYYKQEVGKSEVVIKGATTTGEGRINQAGNTRINYTIRGEFLPFGAFAKFGDYSEGDLVREQTPKLSFGVGYNKNNGTNRTAGQLGTFINESITMEAAFADAIFKYKGWAASVEYINRNTKNPFVTGLDNKDLFVYKGQGVNTQVSYVFRNNFEIATRFSAIMPHTDIQTLTSPYKIYGLGGSKYLMGHRTKVQINLFYRQQPGFKTIESKGNFSAVFQVELGI